MNDDSRTRTEAAPHSALETFATREVNRATIRPISNLTERCFARWFFGRSPFAPAWARRLSCHLTFAFAGANRFFAFPFGPQPTPRAVRIRDRAAARVSLSSRFLAQHHDQVVCQAHRYQQSFDR